MTRVYHFWCCFKVSTGIFLLLFGFLFLLVYNIYTFTWNQKLIMGESEILTHNSSVDTPYPYPYKFLINQPGKCRHQTPFLLLLVFGESNDVATRNAIRETWGDEKIYDYVVIRIFLIGVSPEATLVSQQLLNNESKIYGDIVQQDFQDTYYNLTLKTLMGMEWVTKFCPGASYVMKIDSDMFLNADYLIHHILQPELPIRMNYFTGYIVANTGPIRDTASKWYVPKEIYQNNTYPPYCAGPGYVFSADMAKKIYDVAQVIRIIPVEDSFMGICLYELNIQLSKPPPRIFNGHRIEYKPCKFRKLVTVHHYNKDELLKIWPDFRSKRTFECKKWEGEI